MARAHRRTATKVRDGRVQRKNDWTPSRGDYHRWTQRDIRIDRQDPGEGCRHLVTVAELRRFLGLLPDWEELTVGLQALVLAPSIDAMGWCSPGVVALCSWKADLWWNDAYPAFADEHRDVFARLGVEPVKVGGRIEVRWTEPQARAFALLHVLTHELGHHHDRMTNRSKVRLPRGEPYAEAYAVRVMDEVFEPYVDAFGI